MEKFHEPKIPYGYKDLEPVISEQLLTLHHSKHHVAYTNAANALLKKIQETRDKDAELDYRAVSKSFAFNAGGHILHEIFWKNMTSPAEALAKAGKPSGELLTAIEKEFGSFDRFKKEFSETAKSVEGSGWALLVFFKEHGETGALSIIQIEKHNVNLYPEQKILLCLDVWEHAYYLDYKNDRAKYIENWWNIVNWDDVEKRYKD